MLDLRHLAEQCGPWLPLFVFCARIVDVSMDTFRMICVIRGHRFLAAIVGFFQILIWLTAISSVVGHLDRPLNVIAYAGGFATGNWIGLWIESKLALGLQIVRIISREESCMAERLREAGYVVTELHGEGRDMPVSICFVAAYRRHVPDLIKKGGEIEPSMITTVEDVRSTNFVPRHFVPEKSSSLLAALRMR